MSKEVQFTRRAFKTSGIVVISIPKETREAHNIEAGDLLDVALKKVNDSDKEP